MSKPVQIVDLFSGPGGLGEGFSSCRGSDGSRAYEIAVSIEKDRAAHKTLRLRAFLRQFEEYPPDYYSWIAGKHECPDWKELYPRQWKAAENEALCAELGKPETAATLSEKITATKRLAGDRTLLIGGPPCQAYSLAGRSRNAGILDYRPKDDDRHFLYREYCRVVNELNPAVFVMENVKGMLSSSVEGLVIFEQVVSDLERAGSGYRLVSLSAGVQSDAEPEPKDFVIRAEDHGIPQARHRVIIVGIRSDVACNFTPRLQRRNAQVPVRDMLTGLPRLRSGLSRRDDEHAWYDAVVDAMEIVGKIIRDYPGENFSGFLDELDRVEERLLTISQTGRSSHARKSLSRKLQPELSAFLDDPKLRGCDLGTLRVADVYAAGQVKERTSVLQSKTRQPVRFEITEGTRKSLKAWLDDPELVGWECLRPGRFYERFRISTHQYARLVRGWVTSLGSEPSSYGTHSMRRTKVAQIYRKTGNLRAVQLLLGHTKMDSTVRYLDVELEDALANSEVVEI